MKERVLNHQIVFQHLFLVLILYLYIFAIPFKFIPIGLDKIFFIWAIWYISFKNNWTSFYNTFKNESNFLLLFCIISLLVGLFHFQVNNYFIYDLLFSTELFIVPYAIFKCFSKNKLRIDRASIDACVIAGGISLFLLLNPEVSTYVKSDLIKYSELALKNFPWRGFGLSDGLLFAYPIVEGIAISLILLGAISISSNKILNYSSIVLMLFAIIPNARSGFIPVIISIILLALFQFKRFASLSIITYMIIVLLSTIALTFIESNDSIQQTFEWSLTSFDILSDLSEGNKTENVNALLDTMIILPTDISGWLIGNGVVISGIDHGSDIGYIVRLYYGGIIYVFMMIGFLLMMLNRMYKYDKCISLLLFLTVIYSNYKGDFFINSPLSRFSILIYVCCIAGNMFTINKRLNKFR